MKIFNKYKFSDKSQTLGGTISTAMGAAAVVSFGYGVWLSFKAAGEAGPVVGSFGLLSFMMAAIGTIIGLLSFKEDDKFYTLSKIGSMVCGIMAIFMLSVFLMGLGV